MLRFFRRSPPWGFALPAIAAAYVAFTLDLAYHRPRAGRSLKGRVQAGASGTLMTINDIAPTKPIATKTFRSPAADAPRHARRSWRSIAVRAADDGGQPALFQRKFARLDGLEGPHGSWRRSCRC
jgi:hypothetical protein